MSQKNSNTTKKKGIHETFNRIVNAVKELPNYYRYNIYSLIVIATVAVVLALPPILSLINNILITVGNVFIAIFTEREMVPHSSSSLSTFIFAIVSVLAECVFCKIFCGIAIKINKK